MFKKHGENSFLRNLFESSSIYYKNQIYCIHKKNLGTSFSMPENYKLSVYKFIKLYIYISSRNLYGLVSLLIYIKNII